MATISENLQTIKDSTDAIKQAIIDKGGTIEGNITTWASAISGISGGEDSSDEEYVFFGTLNYSGSTVTATGTLNKIPEGNANYYLLALGAHPVLPSRLYYAKHLISDIGPYTLIVDFEESTGNEKLAICILSMARNIHTVIPVTFSFQSGGSPN